MEELLKEMSVNTNNICIKLEEIANVLSQTDWLGIIGPWILSIISGIIGYKISSRNEKRAFKRNCHIEYLSFTNDFLNEVKNKTIERDQEAARNISTATNNISQIKKG